MYQSVLLATDLMASSHDIVLQAKQVADVFQAKCFIVHVIEPPASTIYAAALGFAEFVDPATEDAKTTLKTLADELTIPEEQQFVKVGSIRNEINKLALELKVDLIIIGSHSKTGFSHILGSTANGVLHTAHCDVLTLRHHQ